MLGSLVGTHGFPECGDSVGCSGQGDGDQTTQEQGQNVATNAAYQEGGYAGEGGGGDGAEGGVMAAAHRDDDWQPPPPDDDGYRGGGTGSSGYEAQQEGHPQQPVDTSHGQGQHEAQYQAPAEHEQERRQGRDGDCAATGGDTAAYDAAAGPPEQWDFESPAHASAEPFRDATNGAVGAASMRGERGDQEEREQWCGGSPCVGPSPVAAAAADPGGDAQGADGGVDETPQHHQQPQSQAQQSWPPHVSLPLSSAVGVLPGAIPPGVVFERDEMPDSSDDDMEDAEPPPQRATASAAGDKALARAATASAGTAAAEDGCPLPRRGGSEAAGALVGGAPATPGGVAAVAAAAAAATPGGEGRLGTDEDSGEALVLPAGMDVAAILSRINYGTGF